MQNTPCLEHFWKLTCRKNERRSGAQHISKSKRTKHTNAGALGSCDVEKVNAAVARSTFPSQNAQSTPFSDHFSKLRCRKNARNCGPKHIYPSQKVKNTTHVRTTFQRSDVVLRGRRKGFCTLPKVRKT